MEQRTIRLAWETYQERGAKPGNVPAAIVASWERSRSFGIAAERMRAPRADEPELFRRRLQSVDLIAAARPALEHSSFLLKDAACMMIVTDASGFILETAGDQRVLETGRLNHLETGGHWDEVAIGTNAIGTALAVSRPVQIRGAEHFCEDVQRWTCAAAPVRCAQSGEMLGVVDISGPAHAFNPQSLALAVAIGREIEASLVKAAKMEHEILLRHFLSKRSIWLSEDILVVDRRGFIVHSTRDGAKRLGAERSAALARDMRAIIGAARPQAWADNCRARFANASLEIVESEGATVGCLIVLHRARQRQIAPASSRARHDETAGEFDSILGDSDAMQNIREKARRLAANTMPILIEGETGAGKELFARAIRAASPFANGPFVPVNCGGIARDLIASELFGYEKGAFTGADASGRPGKIEKADKGVLCLDEIGEMPLDLQSYLLRVLEDGVVYRVGDHEGRRVEIRILAMTNRDLAAEVESGRFRRDLYYRIAAARLRIPPLRERSGDIPLLAERLAADAAKRLGRSAPIFSDEAMSLLCHYRWPGNVRELRNVIDALVTLNNSDHIDVCDLPQEIPDGLAAREIATISAGAAASAALTRAGDLKSAERQTILTQVEACGGNLTEAARRLGIARSTLYVRLAKYGFARPAGS